jgi:Cu2+-exporting ATPase
MKKNLKIEGMMCEHCEARVKKTLLAIDGVEEALVSHKEGCAEVTLTKDVSDETLKSAVEAQDYKVTEIK